MPTPRAGGGDSTPPGMVVISSTEMYRTMDAMRFDMAAIKTSVKDMQKRLASLEKWKWGMLAIGLGGGTGVSQIIERLTAG